MINFNILQSLAGNNEMPHIVAQLPSAAPSGGDDSLLSLLGGIKGLIGQSIGQPTQQTGNFQGSGVNPQYVQNAVTNPAALNTQPRLSQLVDQNVGDLFKRPAFQTALEAQQKAQQAGVTNSPILTVVDYSLPADQKRLWVLDTNKKQVLMNTYVAQGATPGFSNIPGSHQSSLGTYLTGNEYYSNSMNRDALKLQGLDRGVNDNAFARGIVIHGGSYVGPDKQGTSWGCFAVPNSDTQQLIGLTKNGTIVHAYAPDNTAQNNFKSNLTPSAKQNFAAFQTQSNIQHPSLQAVMNGIAHVESSDSSTPYTLISKPAGNGDRSYGKYQIMGNNIPSWTKEATGTAYTRQQFLNNPQIQDQTASYMLNKSLKQGYSPDDAAMIWFTGRPYNKTGNVKDSYGTTKDMYLKKFREGMQQGLPQTLNDIQPIVPKPQTQIPVQQPIAQPPAAPTGPLNPSTAVLAQGLGGLAPNNPNQIGQPFTIGNGVNWHGLQNIWGI